ncbi:MAG: ferridoxin [Desulfobacteraceae bacterium IS3]|nr:MAG: ferridoxin [Desulfobacteraceae bacterium IS3]
MSLFAVDTEKCQRDGICADECPLRLIVWKDKNSFPRPVPNAGEFCINCGHCVAVCPTGALSLKTMTPEQCPPVKQDWLLNSEEAEHFLRARRSIRTYKSQPVPQETLAKLIDIARFAPSGHNRQPVRWIVVSGEKEVAKLAGIVADWMRHVLKTEPETGKMMYLDRVVKAWESGVDTICRKSPHIVIAHAAKADRTAPPACFIALSYLELAAPALGLGACWAGYFNMAATLWQPMQKALELPAENISFGAMMVGYPKYKYHRLPLRNEAQIQWIQGK